MIECLKPLSAAASSCKICGGQASLFGVVDFNRSCEDWREVFFPLSGVPVYYRRCAECKFLFTDAFDDWSIEQFKTHIYNDAYKLIDPEYESARARTNADAVARLWGAVKTETRLLDYGGGNGTFCALLRDAGFPVAVTFDPMVPEHATPPEGKFDLVTSFETFEHLPDPAAIASILEFIAEPGIVFFTTALQPADIEKQRLNWWYAAPRNGHVSLFSTEALRRAWGRHGYKVATLAGSFHFAFRTLPPLLAHVDTSSALRGPGAFAS
jgi:SAM-dependent methyltransferase